MKTSNEVGTPIAATNEQANAASIDAAAPLALQETTTTKPVPKRAPAWKFTRITVNEFRRRYFLDGSRPRQRDVVRWIEEGTVEGERLPAYLIDGKYFIQIVAAEAFLDACKKVEKRPSLYKPRPAAGENWRQKHTFNELRKFGFDFL